MPDEDWPQDRAQRNIILGDFDMTTQYGDRRQASQSSSSGPSHAALPWVLRGPWRLLEWRPFALLMLCAEEMRAPVRQSGWTLRLLVVVMCRPDSGAASSYRGNST